MLFNHRICYGFHTVTIYILVLLLFFPEINGLLYDDINMDLAVETGSLDLISVVSI